MEDKLNEIYSAESFRKLGHELIDLLSKHLQDVHNDKEPAINWQKPEEHLEFWKNYEIGNKSPIELFKDILGRSINLHHPKYIGHQVSSPAPLSILSGLFEDFMNNSMAVYEMGPAGTIIEKVVIEYLCKKVGYSNNGDGLITSGGTIGNLTALLAARQVVAKSDVWENGLNDELGVVVSAEAHYSIDRALRIMGFGSKGIIKIPVNNNFSIDTSLLDEYYNKAKNNGIRVIAVVGCAPSTSTGMYDDLEALAEFCKKMNLWFHVDGAHGGAVVFSEKYKYLAKGIEKADSIVIDGHKMLMTPGIMTFLLFKDKNHSYSTFNQKANYLLAKSDEEEWYNIARRTIECTKSMMSVKFFSLLAVYGEDIFGQFVDNQYDLGKSLAKLIKQRNNFELALEPNSNIVCFRYFKKNKSEDELNKLNAFIRYEILKKGEFYIVQTSLNEKVYMRTTIMNAKTTTDILSELLDEIERIAINIK